MLKPRLLILMYHRVSDPSRPGSVALFAQHLQKLAEKYPIVSPGEQLRAPFSVCLTFDDAYYDFFDTVFPLLKQLKIPAVLGIPVDYIQEKTAVEAEQRLSVPYPEALEPPYHRDLSPLCTWEELREMAASGLVNMASHSYSHCHLGRETDNWAKEVSHSKLEIEKQLGIDVNTFIYPFGNVSRRLAHTVAKHYPYSMRIGGALNRGWAPLLYRVDAEHYWPTGSIPENFSRFARRYWFNRLRRK